MINFTSRYCSIGQVLSLGCVVAALLLLPGVPYITGLLAMFAVWVTVLIAYRCSPYATTRGALVLMAAWTLLAVGVIINIWYFTTVSGGTLQHPVLENFDADRHYYTAVKCYEGELKEGYVDHIAMFFGLMMKIFGGNILTVLVVNMACGLLGIVATGYIAGVLCSSSMPGTRASSLAMAMMSSICYFMAINTVALKESACVLGMALVAVGLLAVVRKSVSQALLWRYFAAFVLGVMLVTISRMVYLGVVIMGMVFCLKLNRRSLSLLAAMAVVIAIAAYFSNIFTPFWAEPHLKTTPERPDAFVFYHPGHEAYDSVADHLLASPLWLRVLCLPLTAGVQFLIPLFFNICRDYQFGPTMTIAHFGIPWYIIGGMIFYFVLFKLLRAPDTLRRYVAWGALAWLVPAFTTVGLVSRYTFAMLPMIIPAAVITASLYFNERKFRIFAISFGALLVIALTAAWFLTR